MVIEGEGIDGIPIGLSNGARTTTSGGGYFAFSDIEAGRYTITISSPADARLDAITMLGREDGRTDERRCQLGT